MDRPQSHVARRGDDSGLAVALYGQQHGSALVPWAGGLIGLDSSADLEPSFFVLLLEKVIEQFGK